MLKTNNELKERRNNDFELTNEAICIHIVQSIQFA